jgi:cobalamin synthase
MRRSALFMVCTGLAALSGVLACVLAVVAWQRAGLPYNEEGHYFDGLVNYDQQSVLVYAVMAIIALLLALGLAWAAMRSQQR